MNWTRLLRSEIESNYTTTERLMDRVHPDSLRWKPQSGANRMTSCEARSNSAAGIGKG